MQIAKELWAMFEIWDNARVTSAYSKRAALRLKTKALISEDRHSR